MSDASSIARMALEKHQEETGHDGSARSCGEDAQGASVACPMCRWQVFVELTDGQA